MAVSPSKINRFKVQAGNIELQEDPIAIEEPMLIRLLQGNTSAVFSLTMRTPGNDHELAYGLLFSEGIIHKSLDVESLKVSQDGQESEENILEVRLRDDLPVDLDQFERHYASYSGCGLCGKTSLQALELKQSKDFKPVNSKLGNALIQKLKGLLAEQPLFSQTGGVHAAGLIYENAGELCLADSPFFEDVGRHNALDKLIGHELLTHDLAQPGILVLSGRIGFELVQKAIMAGFSIIVALGAPSNLAIQAANQFNVALVGFAKDNSFNLYTAHRELITE